ncbi:MAG: nucleotide pyrophosphatase [Deltaproteobacteria bacterium]|nr:MAG: nucleotide pyrophosphatase [Deltaproteobacteria bacterium]
MRTSIRSCASNSKRSGTWAVAADGAPASPRRAASATGLRPAACARDAAIDEDRAGRRRRFARALAIAAVAAAAWGAPATAHAYVGPGAGIAVATTAMALLVSTVLVVVGLLLWPVRWLWRQLTAKRPPKTPRIDRAVIVGLDGLDPKLVDRFMAEGKLPALAKLAECGTYRRLQTTFPAMSPVAWSSFATGVNPAKHGIFDFLTRDRRTYMADLSSADITPSSRALRIGNLQIPIGKPQLKLLRKSRPFWDILGRYRIPCSILRVPITFPPERFPGYMLSAMCVPDLQGSQGTYTYFTTGGADDEERVGGRRTVVTVDGDRVRTFLEGPPNPMRRDGRPVRAPLDIRIDRAARAARLTVGRHTVTLTLGEYTDWVEVAFPMRLGFKMRGICRFRLLEVGEDVFRMYVTPINIDPVAPVLPISHPKVFATFLAKLIGRYATLGLAEDTWALNEGVLDEQAFLEQAWENHREREAMFFQMLRRTKRGVIACVFDGTDRIQHMFMRYVDDGHPARRDDADRWGKVIEDTYVRMDRMVQRVLDEVGDDPRTMVIVMSDHGFQTFRRGVNLNAWLRQRGYLVLADGADGTGEWFEGVDWSRTRAFALGLGGIFLNVRGREAQGIVEPGDGARALADQIAAELTGLRDDEVGAVAIDNAYAAHRIYQGPYADDAPDVIVGYAAGWRASWEGVRGISAGEVFTDNTRAWSGDHCIDPKLVPGVLFANRELAPAHDDDPAISDVAPTLLDLFGVPAPRYMDGATLAR